MSFENIFGGGGSGARSAEESAQKVSEKIPGARSAWEGVDPELFDDLPEVARDPKIIRETSPEAFSVMGDFIAPLFKNTQDVAAEQRESSENPESTADMASAAKDTAFEKVEVEIRDEDRPEISEEEKEELKKANRDSGGNAGRPGGGSAEG